MGHVSISVLGLVASIVLLVQIGLHTELLQGNSGTLDSSNESVNQYIDDASQNSDVDTFSSSILSSIRSIGRNRRFLPKPAISTEASGVANSSDKITATTAEVVTSLHTQGSVVDPTKTTKAKGGNTTTNPWDGVSPNLMIERFYTGNFIEPNIPLCEMKTGNITLVVLLPSAVYNFQQRDAVRKTWGSYALRKDVVIGFMVGNPKLSHVNNDTLLEYFQKEMELFGDIIIADMKDSYHNLTLKVLYMLEWTSTYCNSAKFFMKTDDDVFLNVPLVLNFISKIKESDSVQPKIYGHVFEGHMPQRNTTHKHHVKYDIYPHDMKYPRFSSGPSYLISQMAIRPLLDHAVRLPLFNLEDVFLTGFVASDLNIPRINVTQFRNEMENPFNMPACRLINTIAGMTDGSATQIYHVWYNYLMGRYLCKYLKPR